MLACGAVARAKDRRPTWVRNLPPAGRWSCAGSSGSGGARTHRATHVDRAAPGDCAARDHDDHSGTPESLGEQVLVVAADIRSAAGERPEPRRRPLTSWNLAALPTSLREHSRDAVLGQLLDQAPQLVSLRAHLSSVARDIPASPDAIGEPRPPLCSNGHRQDRCVSIRCLMVPPWCEITATRV